MNPFSNSLTNLYYNKKKDRMQYCVRPEKFHA